MKKNYNDPREEEFLRFNNELKKMKLIMEYGACFGEPDPSLPPEVESIWLDQIFIFEEAYAKKEILTVYEKIGMPDFRFVEEIPEKDIHYELLQMVQLLNKNQIVIDSRQEVNDREMYRFITEQLFPELIDNIPLAGFIHHFIYEEFME
jgi:hypothetical protein